MLFIFPILFVFPSLFEVAAFWWWCRKRAVSLQQRRGCAATPSKRMKWRQARASDSHTPHSLWLVGCGPSTKPASLPKTPPKNLRQHRLFKKKQSILTSASTSWRNDLPLAIGFSFPNTPSPPVATGCTSPSSPLHSETDRGGRVWASLALPGGCWSAVASPGHWSGAQAKKRATLPGARSRRRHYGALRWLCRQRHAPRAHVCCACITGAVTRTECPASSVGRGDEMQPEHLTSNWSLFITQGQLIELL